MNFGAFAIVALLAATGTLHAAEQEETFTIPDPGSDAIKGDKLSPLVDRSDPKAINNVGWLWARGTGGVKQDYTEALNWWKYAAKLGYTPSMNNVGLLYANGHGVKQDFDEAFKWWRRAAERGNAWAMNAIGDLYENGQGVPQNDELALKWYQEAAAEGDSLAMWNAGNLIEQGKGADRSYAEASKWYLQSADHGNPLAMTSMGRVHGDGLGVAANPVEACAWYTVAALRFTDEYADERAENQRLLQETATRLTPAQRDQANQRAEELDRKFARPTKGKPNGGDDA